jgi:hypothetical protein
MKKENSVIILNNILKSKALLYLVIFIFLFKIFVSLISVNFPNNIFFADITKSTLVNMLNQTRSSLGIDTLTESEQLNQAARLKAEDMVRNGYFSHISPTGITPWYWFKISGYSYKYAGENLAIGFYNSEDVYNAWLNSASHKENMLNSAYTEIGTAILTGFGNNNAIIVVQLFGAPKAIATTATAENIPEQAKQSENTAPTTSERVLSSSTSLEVYSNNGINNFYSKFVNFAIYSYDTLLQYVIYGLSAIIILLSAGLLLINFNNQVNSGLVLRSMILIALLTVSALISNDSIISLLPHQITI